MAAAEPGAQSVAHILQHLLNITPFSDTNVIVVLVVVLILDRNTLYWLLNKLRNVAKLLMKLIDTEAASRTEGIRQGGRSSKSKRLVSKRRR